MGFLGILPSLLSVAVTVIVSDPTPRELLNLASAAAIDSGTHMLSSSAAVQRTKLDASDLVTAADVECQSMLTKRILEVYPTHTVLGEESVAPGIDAAVDAAAALADAEVWVRVLPIGFVFCQLPFAQFLPTSHLFILLLICDAVGVDFRSD